MHTSRSHHSQNIPNTEISQSPATGSELNTDVNDPQSRRMDNDALLSSPIPDLFQYTQPNTEQRCVKISIYVHT